MRKDAHTSFNVPRHQIFIFIARVLGENLRTRVKVMIKITFTGVALRYSFTSKTMD